MKSDSAIRLHIIAVTAILLTAALGLVAHAGADRASDSPKSASRLSGKRIGRVPEVVRAGDFQGSMPPDETIRMMLSFEMRDEAGLEVLTAALYEPSSAEYHKWLTPAEFGARFGRTRAEYDQAVDWLKGNGFDVDSTFSNRLAIGFTGPISAVQTAFHVQMARYQDTSSNRLFYSNQQPPVLPAQLDAIAVGLEGLTDAFEYHTGARRVRQVSMESIKSAAARPGKAPTDAITPAGTPASPNFLAPADLAHVYNYKPLNDANVLGQGQRAGIIIDSDVNDSDIALHRSTFNLPAANVVRKIPTGFTNPGIRSGGEDEAVLDICTISAAAPMAEIDLVVIPALSFGNVIAAEQFVVDANNIKIVNESFGACEQDNFSTAEQNLFAQAVAQGIAFFASTGDDGAECGSNRFAGTMQIGCPACYPGVTAVGGTQIQATFDPQTGQIISVQSEGVWNVAPGVTTNCTGGGEPFPAGATGGGVSTMVALPSYQASAQGFSGGVPAGQNRFIPDVSAIAGPPFTVAFIGGKGFLFIGTSESSPLWAGMMTLVNQFTGANQGSPNPALYQLGVSQFKNGGAAAFQDVTTGNNGTQPRQPCAPNGTAGFGAAVGYDAATGWGTPDVNTIAHLLAVVPPSLSQITAHLQDDTLTITGTATDPAGNITQGDVTLFDSKGATVADTSRFAVNLGTASSASFTLTIHNAAAFPTAMKAGVVLFDGTGLGSTQAIADFSQADPGGPQLSSGSFDAVDTLLTVKGVGFADTLQVESNDVVLGSSVKIKNKGGAKLKIIGTAAQLNLLAGPNRIRIIMNGHLSNILVVQN